MRNTHLIDSVLEAHEVTVQITGPWGEVARMNVAMPDLRSAPRKVYGDWGPMYQVSVPADQPIEVSVLRSASMESSIEMLDMECVQIDSPMLAEAREATPLVMKLPLEQEGFTLHVHYDTQGCPAAAELKPNADKADLYGTYTAQISTEPKTPTPVLDWGKTASAHTGMGNERYG